MGGVLASGAGDVMKFDITILFSSVTIGHVAL
jgi:hypothetical protein